MKRSYLLIFVLSMYLLTFMIPQNFGALPKTITYNAGTNTITAIGGTNGNPINFLDLWNADQAGGWGVISNNNGSNIQFEFNCRIILGNGTVAGETYFKDTKKQITVTEKGLTANWHIFIRTKAYSYVTFGTLLDVATKDSKDGCDFLFDVNVYRPCIFFDTRLDNNNDRFLYFYSCSFGNEGSTGNRVPMFLKYGDHRVWNTLLRGGCSGLIIQTQSGTTNSIYNIISVGGATSMFQMYSTHGLTIDSIYSTGGNDMIWTQGNNNFNLTNVYAIRYGFLFDGSTNADGLYYLIDFDVDDWVFDWTDATTDGEVYRSYSLALTVTYPNGTVINGTSTGARVVIQNFGNSSGVKYNATLNNDGTINTTIFNMGFYNRTGGNTIFDYNPYELTIYNVTGFQTYAKNFSLSDPYDWRIALIPDVSGGYAGFSFLAFGLIIGVVVGSLLFIAKTH